MFKNMTTSKCLTYIITFAYIIQVAMANYVKTKYKIDLTPILNYTTPLEFTIVCAYFGKSSYENNIKIKGSIDKSLQAISQPLKLSQELDNIDKQENINISEQSIVYTTPTDNDFNQMGLADPVDIYKNH